MNRIVIVGKNNELPRRIFTPRPCPRCEGRGGRLYENEDALRMRETWVPCAQCHGRGSL